MNDILETLRKMLGARADYDIGYWWNAVDLAIDELDKLKRIIEDREAEIERLHEREMNAKCCHCGGVIFAVEDEWAKAKAEIEHMSVAIENSGSMAFAYKQEQEIERLCHELADAHGVAQACEMRAEKAEAEIERLRGHINWLNDANDGGRLAIDEIDRLREGLDSMIEHNDNAMAEIEQLRHEVKLREQICADATLYARRLQEADDEIERLREENSTFSDSLAAKADRIDRLGETVARQVAEIERLRGLLRDALVSGATPYWYDRVREALGERDD